MIKIQGQQIPSGTNEEETQCSLPGVQMREGHNAVPHILCSTLFFIIQNDWQPNYTVFGMVDQQPTTWVYKPSHRFINHYIGL